MLIEAWQKKMKELLTPDRAIGMDVRLVDLGAEAQIHPVRLIGRIAGRQNADGRWDGPFYG